MKRLDPRARHGAEALSHQVKAGVMPIERLAKRERSRRPLASVSAKRTESGEPVGLKRTQMARSESKLKRTPLGHCTDEQKARVADLACIHCGEHAGHCHPAHVIDSGKVDIEIANDVRAVVPLCATCHRLYDELKIDLSRDLEPVWRDAWEWAVGAVGFFRAMHRITGKRWAPVEAEAA